jgi:hypothetical protein
VTTIGGADLALQTESFDVFISYARVDGRHAADIDSVLRAGGLTSFFDRRNLSPGLPWVRGLEKALNASKAAIILIGPQGLGNTQHYERDLALVRQTRDPSFPIVAVILPNARIDRPSNFLNILTWIDFSHVATVSDAPAELEQLVAAVQGSQTSWADAVREAICPYRGLDAFREEDAAFFFGRGSADDPESPVGQLVRKIRDYPFAMVVGRSGSGKSSLVYAGLLPALRRVRDRFWNVLTLRPGPEPLRALTAAFNSRSEGETAAEYADRISRGADQLRSGDPELLSHMIREQLDRSEGRSDRLLLHVDQWEELYAQAPPSSIDKDRAERHAADVNHFIDLLLGPSQSAPLSVVATVRADFYNALISHQKMRALLPMQQVLLGAMSRTEIESTIIEPAKMVGLVFDPPQLVSRILDDAGEDVGMLPLLQYALQEIWTLREGNAMTADSYARSGGVREAMRLSAERTFDELSPSEKQAARKLFLRLVTPGEGQEDTRARAVMPDEPTLRKIVDQFAGPRTRLLVTGWDRADRPTVEVAHEALIRTWPRLREWIDTNREKLRARAAVLQAKAFWEEYGRREDLLLPAGFHLERARALVSEPTDVSTDDIEEFVVRSNEHEDAKLALMRETQRRLKEAENERERLTQELTRFGKRLARRRPPPKSRGFGVFISYRRADTRHFAGRFFDYLRREIDENDIFFDVNTIPIGVDFKQKIMDAMSNTAVMLCIIGEKWANPTWHRRLLFSFLKEKFDSVQMEIEVALDLGVPIVPILVDDAEMPNETSLPGSISEFAVLNAAVVRSGRSFDVDANAVLDKIKSFRLEGRTSQQ